MINNLARFLNKFSRLNLAENWRQKFKLIINVSMAEYEFQTMQIYSLKKLQLNRLFKKSQFSIHFQLDTRVLTWVISKLRYPRTANVGNGVLKLPNTVEWLRIVTIHNCYVSLLE